MGTNCHLWGLFELVVGTRLFGLVGTTATAANAADGQCNCPELFGGTAG